jgi:cyclopropane fatty-acyl-phospholipid synthase-like methyltransferase
MVEACHLRGLASVIQGNGLDHLVASPDTFDLITAHHFIEHLTKPRIFDFLDEAMISLKPGGRLILTTPNAASLFGARDRYVDFTHEVGFTPESLMQVMQATDYTNVRVLAVRPVVGSWRGSLRDGLWRIAQIFSRAALAIEGRPLLHPIITSASLIGIAEKPATSDLSHR